MVGTLAKEKTMFALVRTPEKDIYQVRSGNFMGQNFGVVVGINDTEIKLKELVQDSAGDWTERSSTLQLQQPDATGGKKMSAQLATRAQSAAAAVRSVACALAAVARAGVRPGRRRPRATASTR